MSDSQASPQRMAAQEHLERARAHLHRGKTERALEEGYLALETDPDFHDVRIFLAETHEAVGETRKAVTQYEQLFFHTEGEEKDRLLDKIRLLDPNTAERHSRIAHLAPDPFVGGGSQASRDDEFLDMDDDMIDAAPTSATGAATTGPQAAPPVPQGQAFQDDDDEFLDAHPPAGLSPGQYQYQDEEQFRQAAMELPVIRELLSRQRTMWDEGSLIEAVLARAKPLTREMSAKAVDAYEQIAGLLGTPLAVPMVIQDASLRPLVCGPRCRYVVFPTGAFQTLGSDEMRYLFGRTLARLACEHVPLSDICSAVLPNSAQPSVLREWQVQAALETIGGPNQLGDEEAAQAAAKKLHMWRLRAELSADHAGLVCCTMIKSAVTAMAKLIAPDVEAAATSTVESLKQRFAGQDLAKMAAIGVDEDPETSEPYAFYRMSMLAWWSKQETCQQLIAQAAR